MGNIGYFIPTENKSEFTEERITQLLQEKFTELNIFLEEGINVHTKNEGVPVIYLWLDKCTLLEPVPEEEKEEWSENDILMEQKIQDLHLDLSLCLCHTHATIGIIQKLNVNVIRFIHSYFQCYLFDEGIHPEYIAPDYIFKNY